MSSRQCHHIVKLRASKIGSTKNREAHHRLRDIVSASFEPDSTVSSHSRVPLITDELDHTIFLCLSAACHCNSYFGSKTTPHADFDLHILCAPKDTDEKRAH